MKRTFTLVWCCDRCSCWINGQFDEKPAFCPNCGKNDKVREVTEGELR